MLFVLLLLSFYVIDCNSIYFVRPSYSFIYSSNLLPLLSILLPLYDYFSFNYHHTSLISFLIPISHPLFPHPSSRPLRGLTSFARPFFFSNLLLTSLLTVIVLLSYFQYSYFYLPV